MTIEKKDLKTGMIVLCRNNRRLECLFGTAHGNFLASNSYNYDLSEWSDDKLKHSSDEDLDIVKVFKRTSRNSYFSGLDQNLAPAFYYDGITVSIEGVKCIVTEEEWEIINYVAEEQHKRRK